jgi:hypothetical protein
MTKIKIVKIADTIAKDVSPNILIDSAPTPAAPIVCATVLSDKIADKGLSMFDLNFNKDFAQLPLSMIVVKYVLGVDNNTDSVREQIKETNKARNK